MEAMQLLGGQSPQTVLMILMFLSFAMLVVMFYLFVRIADDMRKTVRGVAGPMNEQVARLREQVEDLIRVQYEILNAIAPQDPARRKKSPVEEAGAPDAKVIKREFTMTESKAAAAPQAEPDDLLRGNITDFILDE